MSNTTKKKLVKLEEDAHRQAKIQAAKKGKTLQDYLADLVKKDTKQK